MDLRSLFASSAQDSRKKNTTYRILGGYLIVSLVGVLALFAYVWSLQYEMPSMKQLENPEFALSTVVYTADGTELARLHEQQRVWVPLDSIPETVVDALVATEDHRFFQHSGLDLFRTLSVPYHLLQGDLQGASTITQQLARALYRQQIGDATTIERKLKEMVTAVEIERRYTKREILEMYFNTVPFGTNHYGIELAARTFFNTSADSLTLRQGTMLVGVLKGVSYYNPLQHPERARHRRNVVLSQMEKYGYISGQKYDRLRKKPLGLDYSPIDNTSELAPYFTARVRQRLETWGKRTGHDIYTEGLVVHTTLNAELQEIATQALREQAEGLQSVVDVQWGRPSEQLVGRSFSAYAAYKENHPELEPFSYFWDSHPTLLRRMIRETPRYGQLTDSTLTDEEAVDSLLQNRAFLDSLKTVKSRLEAGLVAMDPTTGFVKAWVGGRNYEKNKFDHVDLARRQPGSTFKPFVYAAAIDNGYSPYHELRDSRVTLVNHQNGEQWQPKNFSGYVTNDKFTLRDGLAQSKNTITAGLAKQIGAERIAQYARQMGITSDLDVVPSLALGSSAVTLLEMASAYSTLANMGIRTEPTLITRIEDQEGNVLAQFEPEARVALSEETAYTMIQMLRRVTDHGGTAARIRSQFGITYDVAGKTGTTQHGADGWFLMMHPRLVMGAWVGFDDQRVTFRTNFWGQGAHNALFIVGDFFRRAIESSQTELENVQFTPPPNITQEPDTSSTSETVEVSDGLPEQW